MFSTDIIDSDLFLEMPSSSKCLYYDLGMRADDDGFVSPNKVVRVTGASSDDLKVLAAKKFIIPFESGVIVIKDWKMNNYIQSDRYTATIFKNEKKLLLEDENKSYSLKNPESIQNVYKVDTQVRLELGKVSKENIGFESQNRKTTSFKKEDYKQIMDEYELLKGISLQGSEYLPIQQAIKTMFLDGRSKEDIIQVMRMVAKQDYLDWTIRTVKMKMPEFIKKVRPVSEMSDFDKKALERYENDNLG